MSAYSLTLRSEGEELGLGRFRLELKLGAYRLELKLRPITEEARP